MLEIATPRPIVPKPPRFPIVLSNISKDALDEIETNVTEYMMTEKKKYVNNTFSN